jgi:hypothetical protein
MHFVVSHPPDPRPALIVETMNVVDEMAIDLVKKLMIRRQCPNALLFDDRDCVLLRDTYSNSSASSIEEERLDTASVLARVATRAGLDGRVFDWLRSMAASWSDALPTEPAVAGPFIADIVPAVSGSTIRQVA